mmetsp:Transcript_24223/g.21332  ORF Transcript_24223/g.21332 Transcript_24223/m.21332 type:complete len:229 (-) Transcript_24223:479-1165(-)
MVIESDQKLISCLAITPNSKYLLSGYHEPFVQIWEIQTKKPIGKFSKFDFASSMAVSPDGKKVVIGTTYQYVSIWDFETRTEITNIKDAHLSEINNTLILHNNIQFLTGSRDCSIKLWDLMKFQEKAILKQEGYEMFSKGESDTKHIESEVRCLAISHDDRFIAAGVGPHVKIWHVSTMTLHTEFKDAHDEFTDSVAFVSKKCKWVISAGYDRKVKCWDYEKKSFVGE